ncbi:MAG: SPOR domain-containing protein [Wohlfahrtiimonas sp.]
MAKKYFQAKKQKNPFAKKHPNSKKNRIMTISVVIFFLALGVSAGFSYLSNIGKKDPEKKPEKVVVTTKDAHPKRVVKPISDNDFKGAKEYNFYTQLEERSLVMDGEERFGGIPLDNIHEPPKISLESTALSISSNQPSVKTQNDIVMAPLVLESSQQRVVEPIKSTVKQQPQAKAEGNISLQVGSFSSRKDAEKHQALLSKHGFSTTIMQGKNQSQQDIYRVRMGGFSKQEVESVKKRLSALGVSYFEVK